MTTSCRTWSIDVQQGVIKVALVELLHDSEDSKVFVIRPVARHGFGDANFYAHGACHAAVLGRGYWEEETQVALRNAGGGWHSFLHVAADGLVWSMVRYREPEIVWGINESAGASATPAGAP